MTALSWVPPLTISLLFKQSKLPFLWQVRNSCSAHTWPPLTVMPQRVLPPLGGGAPLVGLRPWAIFLRENSPTASWKLLSTCGCDSERKRRKALSAGFPKAMGLGLSLQSVLWSP